MARPSLRYALYSPLTHSDVGSFCTIGKVCLLRVLHEKHLSMHLVLFELRTYGAWDGVGAKKVMEDAPERLRTSGWDSLRPALEVTVKYS